MNSKIIFPALLACVSLAAPALAQDKGTITLGLGLGVVAPKSDNGTLAGSAATVSNNTRPTVTLEYFLKDNLGVEVLAALPFKHDVTLGGSVDAGSVKHLPPVVSLQYHFANSSAFTPFVGLGVNFTTFFQEDSALGELKLKNSWGLAAHVGVDMKINDKAAVRLDARWADIDADTYLDGAYIGTANIDPVVVGASYVISF